MTLYRIKFDSSSYPFFVVEYDVQAALKRAIQALKDYGSISSRKVSIKEMCSGVQLVLGVLDKEKKTAKS